MNINKYDIGILVSMSIVVIFMSFTMPAMGLAGNNSNTSDVPRFDLSTDAFDIQNEFPDRVNAPGKGVLNKSSNEFDEYEGQTQYEFGSGTSGNGSVFLAAVFVDEVFASNATTQDSVQFTSNNQIKNLTFDGFTFKIQAKNITHGKFEYIVEERPSDNGWLAGIPIINTVVSVSADIAGVLGWGFSIIWFFVISFFEIVIATVTVIVKVTVFIFSLLSWLITTYMNVVNAAPGGWISVMIIIPAIALFLVFAKIAAVLIQVVWI